MRKAIQGILVFLLIFLSAQFIAHGQGIRFNNTYDYESGSEMAWNALELGDQGYLLLGGGWVNKFNDWTGVIIMRIDTSGDIMWQKAIGKIGYAYYSGLGGSLIKTVDGNFAYGGSVRDSATNNSDMMLVKFDSVGDTLWTRQFGGSGFDVADNCTQAPNGNYYIYGTSESFGGGSEDCYLVCTDSSGNFLWQKIYGGSGREVGLSIAPTYDGGFILGGYTNSYGEGIYIIKIDSLGNKKWQKIITVNIASAGGYAFQAKSGDFIIYSMKDNIDGKSFQGYVAKLDSAGEFIWQKTYGKSNEDVFESALELENGDFILAGASKNDSTYEFNGWIMKLSANGDSLWERIYYARADKPNYFRNIKLAQDGGFVIGGDAWGSNQDYWAVKLDSMGCLVPGCDTIGSSIFTLEPDHDIIRLKPNPFIHSTSLTIQSGQLKFNTIIHVSVYDLFGRKVKSVSGLTGQITIFKGNLPSGMYFYKVSAKEKVLGKGKMIIE